MPFKSKTQQRFMFSQKPELAKEFSKKTSKEEFKKLPDKVEQDVFSNIPKRMKIETAIGPAILRLLASKAFSAVKDAGEEGETADHFVEKRWSEDKNRFDYIYQKDIEREKNRKAKDLIKGGKADNKSDSNFNKNSIKAGQKVEMEHTDNPKIAREITRDHLEEFPNYYKGLRKMENELKRTESADLFDSLNNNTLRPKLPAVELADGAPGRSWEWSKHEYSKRMGPKGEYRYNYGVNPQNDYNRKQEEQTKKFVPAEKDVEKKAKSLSQDMNSRVLNPKLGLNPPSKNIQSNIAPSQENNKSIAVPQKERELPNIGNQPFKEQAPSVPQNNGAMPKSETFENKSFEIPSKALPEIPGMGRHQQQSQQEANPFSNPVNQYSSEKPVAGSNMSDQAKNAGNVFDTRSDMPQNKNPLIGALPGMEKMSSQNIIGKENFDAQDNPSLNPLHPDSLGPNAAAKYGACHDAAKRYALQNGGTRYTTTGRNQGMHSIAVSPDNTVYDFVLGIDRMPLNEYMANIPFSFAPNP